MKKHLLLLFLLVLALTTVNAQKITINGTIKDYDTGETLIGVNVFDAGLHKGTTSNNYGFYSYTTDKGQINIIFSYVGYESFTYRALVEKDTTLNVHLKLAHLSEVVIEGSREEVIQERTQMGSINVPIRQIQSAPALFGEVDVLKVLQLLPGVQSGSEGTSGLYVRGGGPDQNLILLDGVPVYNASHLFGFFSVFNADAIKNVELVKGGFPARYGGRLSSVVDISMKEGNMKEFHGEGTIGLIASKLTLEGPIVKDRTSFIVSGRRSYLNLLALPFMRDASNQFGDRDYYFYDLNAKVNHIVDNKNRLYISYYGGADRGYDLREQDYEMGDKRFTNRDENSIGWGNKIAALRWNHTVNQKLFANFSTTYTKYNYNLFTQQEWEIYDEGIKTDSSFYRADYRSGIRDYAFKADFDYIPNTEHYIRFGASHIFHRFTPGVYVEVQKEDVSDWEGGSSQDSREYAFYVEDDISLSKRLKINVGVHFAGFLVGDQHYNSLQPRISSRYLIDDKSSVKASYATMTQFVHLLSNAGVGLPTDLWVPSTSEIGPQQSRQTSIGYYRNLVGGFEWSVEGYYKEMDGLLEYRDGASFLDMGGDWDDKVEVGNGRSYGLEMLLQKKVGKTTGWLGYTLSRTERQFEAFNDNEWFPFRYDRTHDLSLTLSHQLSERFHLSGTWVYGTGNAVTLPTHIFKSEEGLERGNPNAYLEHYGSRNNFRMPAYHRMDLGLNYIRTNKVGQHVINLSVYNAYNRMNPFYLDLQTKYLFPEDGSIKEIRTLVQHSLFPVLPSVSYSLKF